MRSRELKGTRRCSRDSEVVISPAFDGPLCGESARVVVPSRDRNKRAIVGRIGLPMHVVSPALDAAFQCDATAKETTGADRGKLTSGWGGLALAILTPAHQGSVDFDATIEVVACAD